MTNVRSPIFQNIVPKAIENYSAEGLKSQGRTACYKMLQFSACEESNMTPKFSECHYVVETCWNVTYTYFKVRSNVNALSEIGGHKFGCSLASFIHVL